MSLSRNNQQKIREEYFLPFIENIKKLKLDEKKEIEKTMAKLQEAWAGIATEMNTAERELKFIQSYDGYSSLFKKMAKMYLDKNFIETEFADCTQAGVQTYLRALFHQHLGCEELDFLQADNLKSELASHDEIKINRESSPRFFSPKQNDGTNIFYILGTDIKITKRRKFGGSDEEICINRQLSSRETAKSFVDIKEKVKLFSSLYEAIEYAHAKQHGGHLFEAERDGFIPSIWAVYYAGNPDKLNSTQEIVIADKGTSCWHYNRNERHIEVTYAEVSKENVTPIVGAVLYPYSNFASYRIINKVAAADIERLLQEPEEQAEPHRSICLTM